MCTRSASHFREYVSPGPVDFENTVLHDCIHMARRFEGLSIWDTLAHAKSARGVRVPTTFSPTRDGQSAKSKDICKASSVLPA
jgi:hypothetical protein